MWKIVVTDQFKEWYDRLTDPEAEAVTAVVDLLAELGPQLGYPYSSSIRQSRHSHMRELRVQHAGRPYRVLYAFDPQRTAVLLLGGEKTGDDRWYGRSVPEADRLYDDYLIEMGQGRGRR